MNHARLFALIALLLLLSSCRNLETAPPAAATAPATSEAGALPTISPTVEKGAGDLEATAEAVAPTTASAPTRAEGATMGPLPAPTLFGATWDDRELLRSSLIESEQVVVDELNGASVYHMKLLIEEPTAVAGQMEVLYTNQEETPLTEVYFHLFANQLGGAIEVSDVRVNGQEVENVVEDTVLKVTLPAALEPGEAVVVEMAFATTVPPEEESTKYNILAYNDDILALAHFYPMIAVYEDGGWHIEASPPHGDETYADMSHFLVELTAPEEQVIAATGSEVMRSETEGMQTVTIAAGAVRDFYLAMSDRYSVTSEQFGEVTINSYAPAELMGGAEWALDAATHALDSYSRRYGPYPYQELDIVSTTTQALGIEYPGIFANTVRIYDLEENSSGVSSAALLESVTAHEAAHQWFYNLVGNDQLNEPWLDEALSQYATWMYYVDRYGQEAAQGYYDSLRGRWARVDFAEIPIGLPAEDYSGQEYGAIVYGRGPIFLDELADVMGEATFDAFLGNYAETYRWRIASSEDFQTLAETECACDLSTLFEEAVYGK